MIYCRLLDDGKTLGVDSEVLESWLIALDTLVVGRSRGGSRSSGSGGGGDGDAREGAVCCKLADSQPPPSPSCGPGQTRAVFSESSCHPHACRGSG